MFGFIRDLWEGFLDLLYPEGVTCYLCREEIRGEHMYGICSSCIEELTFIRDRGCARCGKLLETGDVCSDCRSFFHYFERAFSVCAYDGKLKEWIYAFKYGNRPVLARPFGKMMACRLRELDADNLPDCIIPVPLYRAKLRQRGYNQSLLLARVVSGELKKPLADALVRVKDTPPLSGLSRHERIKCINGSFKVRNNFITDIKNVLLVDDIYTTGATVSECSRVLKQNGVERVYVLTLASGKSDR